MLAAPSDDPLACVLGQVDIPRESYDDDLVLDFYQRFTAIQEGVLAFPGATKEDQVAVQAACGSILQRVPVSMVHQAHAAGACQLTPATNGRKAPPMFWKLPIT